MRLQVAAAAITASLLPATIVGLAGQSPAAVREASERATLLSLISAVDAAQARETIDDGFAFDNHFLKSTDHTAFVPFKVFTPDPLRSSKQIVMYVRAVSRHDGVRSKDERSFVRDLLLKNGGPVPARQETVFIGSGEMPVGGPASTSIRPATQAAAEASARMRLQERMFEKEREANDAAQKRKESGERDPYRFPFEDYYTTGGAPPIERALALPPGEYDVFVALASRAAGPSPVVSHRTVTIPDFWNDELSLSSIILATDVRTLSAPLSRKDQAVHPYTFGRAEVVTPHRATFSRHDVLSIVYQICNYGSPGTELSADYAFYRTDGGRQLFNRTAPQVLTESDLPPPASAWETQAFATQAVPLQSFTPGDYELEITVRDQLTRAVAKRSASFSVQP